MVEEEQLNKCGRLSDDHTASPKKKKVSPGKCAHDLIWKKKLC